MAKKPIVEPESCGTCRFFLANQMDEYGYCRRFPPVPTIQDEAFVTLWPVVSSSEWCGAFSRKLNS